MHRRTVCLFICIEYSKSLEKKIKKKSLNVFGQWSRVLTNVNFVDLFIKNVLVSSVLFVLESLIFNLIISNDTGGA